MQVHKITLFIVDHDGLGSDACRETLENANYPNDCINPRVLSAESAEIGRWEDSSPLNRSATAPAEIARLFPAA